VLSAAKENGGNGGLGKGTRTKNRYPPPLERSSSHSASPSLGTSSGPKTPYS